MDWNFRQRVLGNVLSGCCSFGVMESSAVQFR
jgi:hypothetical protein